MPRLRATRRRADAQSLSLASGEDTPSRRFPPLEAILNLAWRLRSRLAGGVSFENTIELRAFGAGVLQSGDRRRVRHFGLARCELVAATRGRRHLPRLLTLLMCVNHTSATGAKLGALFAVALRTVSAHAGRIRRIAQDDKDVDAKLRKLREVVIPEIQSSKDLTAAPAR